ncbi:hypothetical protein [Nitrosopumilus cobalaminigenes]|uniref:hypothetical protein n=1 Tax=Nitrosopumilus cobalaminigenes TaxID=1470066 RepID=UPI0015CB55F9|nr:hypothetical protein [Nitrosopumilus cobalaminigenes]
MRTISTKLDSKTAELFLKVCNNEGKCQSEMLRDLIENVCELEENEEDLEIKVEDVKPTIEVIPELENVRIVYD